MWSISYVVVVSPHECRSLGFFPKKPQRVTVIPLFSVLGVAVYQRGAAGGSELVVRSDSSQQISVILTSLDIL